MIEKRRTSASSAALAFAVVLLICIVGIAVLSTVAYSLNLAPNGMPETALFVVEKGRSGSGVAADLERRGLVRSSLFVKIALRLTGNVSRLKTGTYRVSKGMNSMGIIAMIAEGRQATVRVTVPEGYTRKRIALLLESKEVCGAADFLRTTQDPSFLKSAGIPFSNAEGFLFPDTYDFPLMADALEVASAMVRSFFDAMARELPDAPRPDTEAFKRDIVLASIIEREYRLESEAPLMSSVFHNRLRINMPLQSCATVVYVITEIQGKPHPTVLSVKDIAIKDEYNTYIHYGLPPGPISNPGVTALMAAFMPAKTEYLYFRLVDPEKGSHHFSESLSEHNQAGNLYIKAIAGKK